MKYFYKKAISAQPIFYLILCLLLVSCEKDPEAIVGMYSVQDGNIQINQEKIYGSFTDFRDGNEYKTIVIGTQTWMTENLRYLPAVDSVAKGSEDYNTENFKCYYVYGYNGTNVAMAKTYTLQAKLNNIPAGTNIYQTFGVLYNWYAAMDTTSEITSKNDNVQGVCPSGWHLPTLTEYENLIKILGGSTSANSVMKDSTELYWGESDGKVTQSCGFSALPAGNRLTYDQYGFIGINADFWTSTPNSSANAYFRHITNGESGVYATHTMNKDNGLSVRCVKN